ncbi:DUF4328 domain-containing protein [Rubritalea tangerina]|uniref:DUF4328 domain-containing protein n=1 Tax=Rubritalea tangerina TaxID=430798 RepID=A0ABW4ZFM8_9BACT
MSEWQNPYSVGTSMQSLSGGSIRDDLSSRHGTFKDIRLITHLAVACLSVEILLAAISTGFNITAILAEHNGSLDQLYWDEQGNDSIFSHSWDYLADTTLYAYWIGLFVYLMWVYKTQRNTWALSPDTDRPSYTPAWAAVYYLLPIVCLFRPYLIMKDVWHRSASTTHSIINIWWTLWIISIPVSAIATHLLDSEDSAFLTALTWSSIDDLIIITSVAIQIRIIKQITRNQRLLAEGSDSLTLNH